jgi:hypothetical protein
LLHILESQLSPSSSIISDYTQTASAWLANLAFLVFAAMWASLSTALAKVSDNRLVFTGRILFTLAFIAILVGIAFPASMDPRSGSLLSKIQNLLARPGLFLGVILVSIGLLRQDGWKLLAPKLLSLSIAAFVLLAITIIVLIPRDLGVIGQRLIFLTLYVWAALIALRTLKIPHQAEMLTTSNTEF